MEHSKIRNFVIWQKKPVDELNSILWLQFKTTKKKQLFTDIVIEFSIELVNRF